MKYAYLLSLLAVAACAGPQPQVLTPVRLDTAHVTAGADAPARARSVADDPFTRIDRMEWPAPSRIRSAAGAPGPDYWQQRADYTIAATLDTAAQTISGTVTIRYTNHSPDSLPYVWLQLDQNLYRPGSKGSTINPPDSRWGARNFRGGFEIANLQVNGKAAEGKVDDTMMRIDLDAPIAPKGGRATISMGFSFKVPEHGSDRLARDGAFYEIAQWYPRMAVYDDVRGWNTEPYLGQGEFYLEYGDFEYAITAPAGYVIAGTGTLQNAAEVLTPQQRERLARAARSTEVVQIITAEEAQRRPTPGTRTWRFRAENVRDVAWAGAPDFRWDAMSTGPIGGNERGVLAQAYYSWPRAGRGWEDGAENTQWAIRTYSQLFYPYPYPQATSVAGPVGGMEYPMFVMVRYSEQPNGAFRTIDHEHGHEWYPMIVGSNERRYAWMDEGINTYVNAFSNERRTAGHTEWTRAIDNWRQVVERGIQAPLMTPPDRIERAALGAIGYRKPAAVLLTLRNHVVDREAFDRALIEYTRRWAFKHPTPADFFRTVENVTGEDLSWFWRAFFYTEDVLDLGIENVTVRTIDGRSFAVVTVRRNTSVPFPVILRLRLADGTTIDARFPVQLWARAERVDVAVPVPGPVTGARLWPDPSVPDWNAGNDVWGNAPAADPLGPVTGGGLYPSLRQP